MKQRIYIDTSIVGGYFDKVFAATIEIRNPKDLINYEADPTNSRL
jgi:hypothetical protein